MAFCITWIGLELRRRQLHWPSYIGGILAFVIWAATQENLSSGFPTKRVSNQSPQLQRLVRKLKFHL